MGKYIKKVDSDQSRWSEESLTMAIAAIRCKKMSVNEASRQYVILSHTLHRRIVKNSTKKLELGPNGILGYENKICLVNHIKRLESCSFVPTSKDFRILAYLFSEKLGLYGKFRKGWAGYDWFRSFMLRHPDLSIRQSEGPSIAQVQGLSRDVVHQYFNLLKRTMLEHDLANKPIFNVDESGLQVINKVGKVPYCIARR